MVRQGVDFRARPLYYIACPARFNCYTALQLILQLLMLQQLHSSTDGWWGHAKRKELGEKSGKLFFAILEGGELVFMKISPVGNRFGTLKVQTVLHFLDDIGLNTL